MTNLLKKCLLIGGGVLVVVAIVLTIVLWPEKTPDPNIKDKDDDPIVVDPIQLETPKGLTLEGTVLSWTAIPNASKYIVYVNDKEIVVESGNQVDLNGKAVERDKLSVVAVGTGAYKNSSKSTERLYITHVEEATIDSIYAVISDNIKKNFASADESNYQTTVRKVSEEIAYYGIEEKEVNKIAETIDEIITNYKEKDFNKLKPSETVNFLVEQIDKLVALDIDEMVIVVAVKEIVSVYLSTYIEANSDPIRSLGFINAYPGVNTNNNGYSELNSVAICKELLTYIDTLTTLDMEKLSLVLDYIGNYYNAIKKQLPVMLATMDKVVEKDPSGLSEGMDLVYDLMTIKDQFVNVLLTEMPTYTDYYDVVKVFLNVYEIIIPDYVLQAKPIELLEAYYQRIYVLNYDMLNFIKYIDADYFKELSTLILAVYSDIEKIDYQKIDELVSYVYQGDYEAILNTLCELAKMDEEVKDSLINTLTMIIEDIINQDPSKVLNILMTNGQTFVSALMNKSMELMTPELLEVINNLFEAETLRAGLIQMLADIEFNKYFSFKEDKTINDVINALMAKVPTEVITAVQNNLPNSVESAPKAIYTMLDELFAVSDCIVIDYQSIISSINGESISNIIEALLTTEVVDENTFVMIILEYIPISEYVNVDLTSLQENVLKVFEGEFTDTVNELLALTSFDLEKVLTILDLDDIVTISLDGFITKLEELVGEKIINVVTETLAKSTVDEALAYLDQTLAFSDNFNKFVTDVTTDITTMYPIFMDYQPYLVEIIKSLNIDYEKTQVKVLALLNNVKNKIGQFEQSYKHLDITIKEFTEAQWLDLLEKLTYYVRFGDLAEESEETLKEFELLVASLTPELKEKFITLINSLGENAKEFILNMIDSEVFNNVKDRYDLDELIASTAFKEVLSEHLINYLIENYDTINSLLPDFTLEQYETIICTVITSTYLPMNSTDTETLIKLVENKEQVAKCLSTLVDLFKDQDKEVLLECFGQYNLFDLLSDNKPFSELYGTYENTIELSRIVSNLFNNRKEKLYSYLEECTKLDKELGNYDEFFKLEHSLPSDKSADECQVFYYNYLKNVFDNIFIVAEYEVKDNYTSDEKAKLKEVEDFVKVSHISDYEPINSEDVSIDYINGVIYVPNTTLDKNTTYGRSLIVIVNGKICFQTTNNDNNNYLVYFEELAPHLSYKDDHIQFSECYMEMYGFEDYYLPWSQSIDFDSSKVDNDLAVTIDYDKGVIRFKHNENIGNLLLVVKTYNGLFGIDKSEFTMNVEYLRFTTSNGYVEINISGFFHPIYYKNKLSIYRTFFSITENHYLLDRHYDTIELNTEMANEYWNVTK